MAEQKYSESESTSSDSTMLVKIRETILKEMLFIHVKVVNEGGQLEKGRNLNRCFHEIQNCI